MTAALVPARVATAVLRLEAMTLRAIPKNKILDSGSALISGAKDSVIDAGCFEKELNSLTHTDLILTRESDVRP